MLAKLILAAAPFLALVAGAPAPTASAAPKPPTFPSNPDHLNTTTGARPGQGAHQLLLSNPPALNSSRFHNNIALSAQDGIGSVVTGDGLAWYNGDFTVGGSGYQDPNYYYCFRGIKENFPSFNSWMNFYTMFDLNQFHTMVNYDSGPEQGAIYNAIVQVSQEAKVDARLILAVIMQESSGNVRVGCTNNGVQNCGLMQAYAGSVSYDPNNMAASILQMVRDGTQGTSQGPGYVQWISQNSETSYAGPTQGNPYQAARGYNSGSINFADLSDPKGATDSYVSDLANRLLGWNGNTCGNNYWTSCGWAGNAWC